MDLTTLTFIVSSILGNVFYFFNAAVSDVFVSISVIFFNLLLFLYAYYLKKLKIANIFSLFYAILAIDLFSLLPLYLTNSYFTWGLAQFFSFILTLIYMKMIIAIIGSKKSVLKLLFFSIITLGIYSFYFFYSLSKEFKNFVKVKRIENEN
ncbi:MAG: DUF4234 domain-containing protein [Thermosipho sp. (in: Bacteria)]|nr:DUF4234 domain-containing protein [Thermosipho sp. (in: thermotogales)]